MSSIFLSSILTAAVFDLYSAAMLGTDSPLWQAAVWVQVRFFARLSPGVFFYITRIPERWFPIIFDNWVRVACARLVLFGVCLHAHLHPICTPPHSRTHSRRFRVAHYLRL
mgnify:FL=1